MSEVRDDAWAARWLDGVVARPASMTQRALTSIEAHGGLVAIEALARERGVHLLLLTDDRGRELVAASTRPFRVIC